VLFYLEDVQKIVLQPQRTNSFHYSAYKENDYHWQYVNNLI